MTNTTAAQPLDLDKILPCPFCGGVCQVTHGYTTQENWPDGDFSRVFCTRCQARQLFHKTDADAISAWNSRALIAKARAAQPADVGAGCLPKLPEPKCLLPGVYAYTADQMERYAHEYADNTPWLTLAHIICADADIPPGRIDDRLKALRDLLDGHRTGEESPQAAQGVPIVYVNRKELDEANANGGGLLTSEPKPGRYFDMQLYAALPLSSERQAKE